MNKELDLVNKLIEGIDNYEKQTGIKNPPVYISRETLVELQQALIKTKEHNKIIMVFYIIKKKKVNVARLLDSRGRNEYNKRLPIERKLDKNQFDLLKEVLEDE